MLELRPYQRAAIDSFYWYFKRASGNIILEMVTGGGKSLIQAQFMKEVLELFAQRILCVTHVRELVQQNLDELLDIWPEAPAGVNSAGLGRRDTEHSIIFASIQSIYKNAELLGAFNLIIIDECHLVPVRTSSGMYRKFLDDALLLNPKLKVIGMSATPYRLDNGLLTEGDNRLFTHIIPAKKYGGGMATLIKDGYLVPLVTHETRARLDTHGVGSRGGDFVPGELGKAVKGQIETTRAACMEAVRADREHILVFGTDIEHALHIHRIFEALGQKSRVITSKTPQIERERAIRQFKNGGIRFLVSVGVLTTGFNAPNVDLIAFLRPTQSLSLYVQMCGRGMRTHPCKDDCMVMDFAGNIELHGPIDDVNPPVKSKRKGDAPLKECPECIMLLPMNAKVCEFCGHQFPVMPKDMKLSHFFSQDPILSGLDDRGMATVPVSKVTYSIHRKTGKPDSLRVDYWKGLQVAATEWICLFHGGYAQQKAEEWWWEHIGQPYDDISSAIVEAKHHDWVPSEIQIKKEGKYIRVVGRV